MCQTVEVKKTKFKWSFIGYSAGGVPFYYSQKYWLKRNAVKDAKFMRRSIHGRLIIK